MSRSVWHFTHCNMTWHAHSNMTLHSCSMTLCFPDVTFWSPRHFFPPGNCLKRFILGRGIILVMKSARYRLFFQCKQWSNASNECRRTSDWSRWISCNLFILMAVYFRVCLLNQTRARDVCIINDTKQMNGVSGHVQGYTGPGTIWANEMNLVLNHAPGAGSLTRPVDQQSSALLLKHGCPLWH